MENKNNNSGSYTLQNLLDDPLFITWVLQPDEALNAYWQNEQRNHDELSTLLTEARELVSALKFQKDLMSTGEQELLWQQIHTETIAKKKEARIIPLWMRNIAAAVLVGMISFTAFYFYYNGTTEISTEYGQIKTIVLPDHSEVTLNANSQLRYARNWNSSKQREVWIKGEAFFKVNHLHTAGKINIGDRFIAHAGKINVEVLGTTFNINDRRGIVNVALVTGKVAMSIASSHNSALIMKPGDVLEFQANQDTITRKNTKTAQKTSWKNGVLEFDQVTAIEVFNQLEDIYGYKFVIKTPAIKLKKLTGKFSSKNKDNLLKAISLALGITIQKDAANQQFIVQ